MRGEEVERELEKKKPLSIFPFKKYTPKYMSIYDQ